LPALRVGEGTLHRCGQKRVDPIREEPARCSGDEYEDNTADQTTTQLVEMLEERHLSAELFFLSPVYGERF
jgi:hypothetical protein